MPQPSHSGLTPPDGSNIAWPFVPEISYDSTVMNSNENAGLPVEIGKANFDREVLNATQPVLVEVRNQLYSRMHPLSLTFHNKPRSGDLVSRLISSVGLLQGLVVPMRAKALILVGMFALMFCLNWQFALVALFAPWSRPCQVLRPSTLAEANAPAQVQRRRALQALRLQRSSPSEAHSLKLTASPKVPANLARH